MVGENMEVADMVPAENVVAVIVSADKQSKREHPEEIMASPVKAEMFTV